jgi:hypothetical protein
LDDGRSPQRHNFYRQSGGVPWSPNPGKAGKFPEKHFRSNEKDNLFTIGVPAEETKRVAASSKSGEVSFRSGIFLTFIISLEGKLSRVFDRKTRKTLPFQSPFFRKNELPPRSGSAVFFPAKI